MSCVSKVDNMLGIDYSSSDEDIDGRDNRINRFKESPIEEQNNSCVKSMANPFDSNNYELTSSSDEEELSPKTGLIDNNSSVPSIGSGLESTNESKVSIFSNQFKEEEKRQLDSLERHVKMSDDKDLMSGRSDSKSRTICWSFHKYKKCKFGNRCRFRHEDNNFIDVNQIKRSDRKRVGITDSLIPPKRALKAFYGNKT